MMMIENNHSSEDIMRMDMEYDQRRTFRKGHPCSRHTGIFVLLGTVCMFIFMVMTFVIFLHQQRKFSVLENWTNTHNFSATSVKADFQIADKQEKRSDSETLIMSRLNSSLISITSKQEENLHKLEHQQDLSQNEMKGLMNSLSSAVSALTSKLNDAVANQDQKQAETKQTLDILRSSVSALQSDQQSKQRDFESLSSSLSDLKSSVSDLTSSVASVSSSMQDVLQNDVSLMNNLSSALTAVSALTVQLRDAVKKQSEKQTETERSLDSLKSSVQSGQQNTDRNLKSLSSSLSDLKSSVSDLTSSVASVSSKQQTAEERFINALKELKTDPTAKTADVPVACKSGWVSFKSSCFLFSSNKLNWSEAQDYCKEQGALLLKIQDDDLEWAFLNHRTIPIHYWVGLTDQNTGQWRWADDTPYTMNPVRWEPGQPDDWTGHELGEGGEDCVEITYNGKLNDRFCSTKLNFICRVQ